MFYNNKLRGSYLLCISFFLASVIVGVFDIAVSNAMNLQEHLRDMMLASHAVDVSQYLFFRLHYNNYSFLFMLVIPSAVSMLLIVVGHKLITSEDRKLITIITFFFTGVFYSLNAIRFLILFVNLRHQVSRTPLVRELYEPIAEYTGDGLSDERILAFVEIHSILMTVQTTYLITNLGLNLVLAVMAFSILILLTKRIGGLV